MNRDDPFGPEPLARWYWLGAAASLVVMLIGCWLYVSQVTTPTADLPLDQRQIADLVPWWQTAGFAVGVWAGLAGAVGLLLRRRWAEPWLGLSLVGMVVWIGAYFLVRALRETASSDVLSIPAVLLILTWTIFGFARHSRMRGWLK